MSAPDNGGAAFPIPDLYNGAGMSLRDYFAAKAMQGLLSSETRASLKEFAEDAYLMANAMLKARES